MNFEGEFIFEATREQVWEALFDPKVLASALPGTEKFAEVADDQYEAVMNVKVGPVAGIFTGQVELKDKCYPESYTLIAEGKGKPGFAKGTCAIEFHEEEGNKTLMKYDAELDVGGRLASVGQRMIDTVGRSMIRQSLEAINKAIAARLSGTPEKFVAPTQSQFASEVAKDVGRDLLSSKAVWIGGALVLAGVVALILWAVLR